MSAWRVCLRGEESFLFSGRVEDIQGATIDEMLNNENVIQWHPTRGGFVVLFTHTAQPNHHIFGRVFNPSIQRHFLFHITVPPLLFPLYEEMIADGNLLRTEVGKLVFGEPSLLQGSKVEWMQECAFVFGHIVPMLIDPSNDCRSPWPEDLRVD